MTRTHFESKFKILLLNQLVIGVLNYSARCDGARTLCGITVVGRVFFMILVYTFWRRKNESIESLLFMLVQDKAFWTVVKTSRVLKVCVEG